MNSEYCRSAIAVMKFRGGVAEVVGIRRRGRREHDGTASGSEVNRVSYRLGAERLPAVDPAQDDLSGGKQSPEQHGGGVGRRQHGLGLDAALKLLMQPFDDVGGSRALPLAWRQTCEGE